MNSVERENFFDYLSAMYAENADCHCCALRKKCQAKDNRGKCYERVLSELAKATEAYTSAENWVREMIELLEKDRTVCHKAVYLIDKKGKVCITIVYKKRNALEMAKATCREKEFRYPTGLAIAYARLMGLPIHRDFATKHDEIL